MKKIIAFGLTLSISMTFLAGCGGSGSDESAVGGAGREDISISHFSCDPMDVLVGEEATITFTASVSTENETGPEDVRVVDEDDNLIGIMNDDGVDGDETAGDGVYTYECTCAEDEEKVVSCYVDADGVKSRRALLNFYRFYTEEEFEQADGTAARLNDSIGTYLTEENKVQESDAEAAMNAVENVLNEMEKTNEISGFRAGDHCFEITTSSGFPFLYSIEVDGCAAGGSGGDIVTFQPHVGTYGFGYDLSGVFVDLNERDTESTDGSAGKIDGTFSHYSFPENANFDLDNVTLNSLKTFGDYSVILWAGHGGYIDGVGSILATGELVSSAKNLQYSDDVNERCVYYNFSAGDRNTYVVTGGFFEKYLKDDSLSGDLIYLATCDSGKDMLTGGGDEYSIVQTLLDKGASTVFANSETIVCLYNFAMMTDILGYMCESPENDFTYYTASEALSYAKEKNGDRDPYDSAEAAEKAEVILFPGAGTGTEYSFTGFGDVCIETVNATGERIAADQVDIYDLQGNLAAQLNAADAGGPGLYYVTLPAGSYVIRGLAGNGSSDQTELQVTANQTTQCTIQIVTTEPAEEEDEDTGGPGGDETENDAGNPDQEKYGPAEEEVPDESENEVPADGEYQDNTDEPPAEPVSVRTPEETVAQFEDAMNNSDRDSIKDCYAEGLWNLIGSLAYTESLIFSNYKLTIKDIQNTSATTCYIEITETHLEPNLDGSLTEKQGEIDSHMELQGDKWVFLD